jgi:signal transduction histidine kinase
MNQWIDRFHDASAAGPEVDAIPDDTNVLPDADGTRKYLAFVSHELNNNLGGLLCCLHALRNQVAADNIDRHAVGDMLYNAIQVVQDTVSATSRFLHVERARHIGSPPDPAPVRLYELALRLTVQFSPQAQQKGLALRSDVPRDAAVVSNRELIFLVLQNLVGNAVKFSHSGTVRIGADLDHQTDAVTALWVSDEGPGIPPQQLVHIFRAFRRGKPDAAAADEAASVCPFPAGVGLGLTVANEAARLLGARLKVISLPDRGATFSLVFP